MCGLNPHPHPYMRSTVDGAHTHSLTCVLSTLLHACSVAGLHIVAIHGCTCTYPCALTSLLTHCCNTSAWYRYIPMSSYTTATAFPSAALQRCPISGATYNTTMQPFDRFFAMLPHFPSHCKILSERCQVGNTYNKDVSNTTSVRVIEQMQQQLPWQTL